jgi:hypothetical protein
MGINQTDLSFLSSVEGFQKVRSVCDLGDQDLLPEGRASDYWKSLGMRHLSLDVVGDAFRFDLNTDSVPKNWEPFDLVTNCGDTEHVINQLNCFKVIHDLCRVGGLMYHQLPVGGYATHGFFNYNLKFFLALAAANGYTILGSLVTTDALRVEHPGIDGQLTQWLPLIDGRDSGLRIALRKEHRGPFVLPLDVPIAAHPASPPVPLAIRLRRFAGRLLRRAGLVS